MKNIFDYPFKAKELFTQRKTLKRNFQALCEAHMSKKIKIAILGGSTTSDLIQVIELMLLNSGFYPVFYETEFNRYAESVLFDSDSLWSFGPDFVYIHTTSRNLNYQKSAEAIFKEFELIWTTIRSKSQAVIVQNNFEYVQERTFGNLESSSENGKIKLINDLNNYFYNSINQISNLYINDINYLASHIGLNNWFDATYWNAYKIPYSIEVTPYVAKSFNGILNAHFGLSKKCLVLDLDNTLWGGVIGDDGLSGIAIGEGDSLSEAYLEFQKYVKSLKQRGIILAVCSKNEFENAKLGFSHPDSFLKFEDFASFQASWGMKTDALKKIALELNIGLESMVFVDDNPAERELVRNQLPMVAVPDLGEDVSEYAKHLDLNAYFESVKILREDLEKADFYAKNKMRQSEESQFANYQEFLDSLEMVAEIRPFDEINLDRIVQLVNKTNQFNLTTKKLKIDEVRHRIESQKFVNLYGRLRDKFGDNGLVTLISGPIEGKTLEIDIWVMSCRVFKRDLEFAIFDELIMECISLGIEEIAGVYAKSEKNMIVEGLYESLGFTKKSDTKWILSNLKNYKKRNYSIRIEQ